MADHARVLIIVENLTMPVDRRVWQEALALRDAGHQVSVICPKAEGYTQSYERIDGIHVFRHPLPIEATGALGYGLEYSLALFWEFVLAWRVHFKVGFDVIQACNPPDTIFLLGGFFKLLMGTPFIFDHHDINPELFEVKFAKRGFLHRMLLALERMTFRIADVSLATNETFRQIAIERGGMDPERVFIVRSIPDPTRFRRVAPDPALSNGRRHLIGYVGVMGAQDGVDLLLKAMAHLVHDKGRNDLQCALVGSGTELDRLKQMTCDLAIEDYVTFTGFLSGNQLLAAYSSFDVGAIPDPKNVYNDKISMNKVFEYMCLGIPFVQFDLAEGRKVAGDAAHYADNNDPLDLAEKLIGLVDDRAARAAMATLGCERADRLLRWSNERARLLEAYEVALGQKSSSADNEPAIEATV